MLDFSPPHLSCVLVRGFRTSASRFDDVKVIVCPAFAESITEGDLRWEKAEGDSVAQDEVN